MPPDPFAGLLGPLVNVGVAGIMLAWFMFRAEAMYGRVEKTLTRMESTTEAAINRLSQTILLDLIARDSLTPAVKRAVSEALSEVTAAQNKLAGALLTRAEP